MTDLLAATGSVVPVWLIVVIAVLLVGGVLAVVLPRVLRRKG